jgi:ADP-heptose:LPS heptosyltransferase
LIVELDFVSVSFNPQNILVIDFGQLGDVVVSLPALRALRQKFPSSRITVAAGAAAAPVVDLSGFANATLIVDRVALRDGPKLNALWRIGKLVQDVRRAKFDFVIDLHSLSETNLLGYLSGAPYRLFSRRPTRSLDFLSNFRPQPPIEDTSPNKHAVDRYLDVLKPLGVKDAPRTPKLRTRVEDDKAVERLLAKEKADSGVPLVGIFPGAGHPSRRWPLENFSELADKLVRNDEVRIVLFAGPEERELVQEMRGAFPKNAIIFDRLSIAQLASALARLSVFISNDTGPMHIAAAVGTAVVILLDQRAPRSYIPFGEGHRVISGKHINRLTVEQTYTAARELLTTGRTATLFAS